MVLHIAENEIFPVRAVDDTEGQVRPVQSRTENGCFPQAEASFHIFFHQGGRRSGESGDYGFCGKRIDKGFYFPVTRTEIMAPLGNAVCFVNDDHGQGYFGQAVGEIGGFQFFRRHVKQLQTPPEQIAEPLDRFVKRHGGVYIGRGNPLLCKRFHLVFHERNQRRNNNRTVGKEEGGNLEADRLSRAGGHDSQHIPARQNGFDDIFLHRPECIITEIFFKSSAGSIVSSFLQILFYYTSYFPKSGKIKRTAAVPLFLYFKAYLSSTAPAPIRGSARDREG